MVSYPYFFMVLAPSPKGEGWGEAANTRFLVLKEAFKIYWTKFKQAFNLFSCHC